MSGKKNYPLLAAALFLLIQMSQAKVIHNYRFSPTDDPKPGLAGNGITDIQKGNSVLWLGTGHGLSRAVDNGQSFESFEGVEGVGRGSIAGLWVSGDSIWISTAVDTFSQAVGQVVDMGTGLSVSTDGGATWKHFPQPGPTPFQNLSYDIAVHQGNVWITSFGGGLQKSANWGETWEVVPPDERVFNPGSNLNHRAFSVISAMGALWVGTAGGVNKSTDGGQTWTNFNHTNQQQPISGNFIVALAHQQYKTRNIIWAASWKAEGESEFYAVSKSEDGGLSWQTTLHDERPHNFAFDDSVVYVAADGGLFKSTDFGETWYVFPTIEDRVRGEIIATMDYYSALGENGTLWIGSADGLARTSDNGYTFDVFRAFQSTAQSDEPRTYAYPNPFSPIRHNQIGQDGFVRFQYNTLKSTQVTIKVYDFAMDLVKAVLDNESKPGPGDFTALWNGRNEFGDAVANGVYFYSVELDGDGTYWGKVMIVN